MAVRAPTPHPRVDRRVAIAALLLVTAAPLLWFAHLSAMYALVPVACRLGSDLPFHAATAVALFGLVICTVAAFRLASGRSLRETLRRALGADPSIPDRDRAVPTLVAATMAVYFAFIAAMTGIAPLVVDRCA